MSTIADVTITDYIHTNYRQAQNIQTIAVISRPTIILIQSIIFCGIGENRYLCRKCWRARSTAYRVADRRMSGRRKVRATKSTMFPNGKLSVTAEQV